MTEEQDKVKTAAEQIKELLAEGFAAEGIVSPNRLDVLECQMRMVMNNICKMHPAEFKMGSGPLTELEIKDIAAHNKLRSEASQKKVELGSEEES